MWLPVCSLFSLGCAPISVFSCISSDTSFGVILIVRQDTVEEEKVNSTVSCTYRDQKVEHEENVFDECGSAA